MSRVARLSIVASVAVLASLSIGGVAAGGQSWGLDTNFGTDGVDQTFFTESEDYAWAFDIAVQPDGKVVAAGTLHYASGPNGLRAEIAVARYMPDGTLDPTFDGDGRRTVAVGDYAEGFGLALEDVGGQVKIVVVGHVFLDQAPHHRMVVIRLGPDGSLDTDHDSDTTFHMGHDGRVTIGFAGGKSFGRAVAVQPDGKIVVAGDVGTGVPPDQDFALVRLLPGSGELDSSFGVGGSVRIDRSGQDVIRAVAVQRRMAGGEPRIVFGGSILVANGADPVVGRVTLSGDVDLSFGSGGFRRTALRDPEVHASYESVDGLAIDSQRRIVVASSARVVDSSGYPTDIPAIMRYSPKGDLDGAFADGGVARIGPRPPQAYYRTATDVAIGHADSIKWVGYLHYAAAGEATKVEVGGLTPSGKLDLRFGTRGFRRVSIGPGADEGNAIAIDDAGRIVICGTADTSNPNSVRAGFGIARLALQNG